MNDNTNFLKDRIKYDVENGIVKEVVTRFPPEPNAYLHIGHARALVTDFEMAMMYNGKTNLRFDDTNPAKEDAEFVDAIIKDIEWLGFHPANIFYGSDYFEQTYQLAIKLIKKGLAYVCDLSPEETAKYRGDFNTPGTPSPYRNRSVEENLQLFENMKNGMYKEGEKTLRAKIDMASPNINMRDPVFYRILYIKHHRQGDKWCIYPMYDFAHPIQDAIEGITHSLCSLEYDNHRPLYDWVIENCEMEHTPKQIEFGRLNITNTIMSKRYLRALVDSKKVTGYDDPRMPTLVGLRRRGYTADAIKKFIRDAGLSRTNITVDSSGLEACIREDLKLKTMRIMAVKDPLKVTITNYPEGQIEYVEAENNAEVLEMGTRKIAFSRDLYIEREDFLLEKPNKHFKRLALGLEVRLMHAYFIKANEVRYDDAGNIVEVLCTYDPATKSGSGFNERKPNGNIGFVEAHTGRRANFNIFEALITDDDATKDITERVNPNSWKVMEGFVENAKPHFENEEKFQFIRDGYYTVDKTSTDEKLVFNCIVPLKSSVK